MKLRRLLAAALAALALAVPALGIPGAAEPAAVSLHLQMQKYVDGRYVQITEIQPGEVFRVAVVSEGAVAGIGGIRVKLGFNPDLVNLRAGNSECLLADARGEFQYNAVASGINAIWDTTSRDTDAPAGAWMVFYFIARETPVRADAVFTLTVPELFTASHESIGSTASGAAVAVKPAAIPAGDLALYRKLETIAYPGSGDDIAAAEKAYARYTAAQVNAFRIGYPSEYSWYIGARNEFNRLAGLAGEEAVAREAAGFLKDHAAVLAMRVDTVTLADKPAVDRAAAALEALSAQAKIRIAAAQKSLIGDLKKKVDALAEAAEEAANDRQEAAAYREKYALLWKVKPADIAADFENLPTLILEAAAIHDELLPEGAQALLKTERAHLQTLQNEVDRLTADNAKEQQTLAAVQAFQNRWLSVLSLTLDTVQVGDQRALEMMIEDLDDHQTKEVQKRLASRRLMANNLLAAIQVMLEEGGRPAEPARPVQPTQPTGPDTPTEPDGSTQPTEPGNTEPAEPTGSGSAPGPTGPAEPSAPVNGGPAGGIPLVIQILAGILGVSILLLIFPACVLIRTVRQNERVLSGKG